MYKLIGSNNLLQILPTVMSNRMIKDKEKFLNPSKEDIISFTKLKNMSKAVKMFSKHQGNTSESTVTVVVDSDP